MDIQPPTRQFAQFVTRLGQDLTTILALFGLTIVMLLGSRLISPGFGGWQHAEAILLLSSFAIFVAFGQGLVILVRGLDLSVASVMSLGGILAYAWMGHSAVDVAVMLPVVLAITGGVGLINGLGVTIFKVPPFIMTLATSLVVYGAFLGLTGGQPRGEASATLVAVYSMRLAGIPIVIWIMLIFIVAGSLLQSRSTFGRKLYAVGTSPLAAHIAGLPVKALTIAAYAISGVAAGMAGVLMVGYTSGATLAMGQPYLLPSIAAVVVGGASITGGRGTYLATVGGVLLLTTLSTIIAALGLAEGWRTVINGAVILLALLILRDDGTGVWARIGGALTVSGR